MILLWGLPGDRPLNAVRAALTRRGADFVLLDQREVLDQCIELDIGTRIGGEIWSGPRRIVLDRVTALYVRVYETRKMRHFIQSDASAQLRVLEVEAALWGWADEAQATVVNRPSAMASNGSKPYQTALIRQAGFLVPDTLVTTDPDAAEEFWDRHQNVIYKSMSGVRSMVSHMGPEHRERLADVAWCPTQFQVQVPGRDHRVHVVGDEVFTVEVVSEADDYRYAHAQGATCELRSAQLPPAVADQSRKIAHALDLPVCGLDLRRTPQGAWYCFEVNPSPCFTYFEIESRRPIANTIAALLSLRE